MNFIILVLLFTNLTFAAKPQEEVGSKKTPQNQSHNQVQDKHGGEIENDIIATPEALIKIKALPYISIVNKRTLKTYKWWLAENKKVPSVYKQLLKKIIVDLKKEAISLSYEFIPTENIEELDKEKLKSLGVNYTLTGEMLYDKKDKNGFAISGFKMKSILDDTDIFFQKYGQIDNLNDLNILLTDLVAHLRSRQIPESSKVTIAQNSLFLKFQIELSFNEIEKIMDQIISEVPELQDVKIYTLQGDETTLALYPKATTQVKNIFTKISDLHFLKGPYNKTIEEKTLILKPYSLEDENKTSAKTSDPTNL